MDKERFTKNKLWFIVAGVLLVGLLIGYGLGFGNRYDGRRNDDTRGRNRLDDTRMSRGGNMMNRDSRMGYQNNQFTRQQNGGMRQAGGGINQHQFTVQTGSLPALTDEQKQSLLFIIEEEKLARDVYTKMYGKWNDKRFYNILNGEQNHRAIMRQYISTYGLEDPTAGSDIGVFKNAELSKLYTDLVAKGEKSLTDALQVGVTIEQKDIADLQGMMKLFSGNTQVLQGLQVLLDGSNNHLQAFQR